jgi:hypothetical protein
VTYWTEVNQGFNEIIDATGENIWRSSPDKDHTYVVKSLSTDRMAEIIEGLIVQSLPVAGQPQYFLQYLVTL